MVTKTLTRAATMLRPRLLPIFGTTTLYIFTFLPSSRAVESMKRFGRNEGDERSVDALLTGGEGASIDGGV